ncbi:MAG: Eco57I restriction-modification methylase domain-containing protein, partial [Promethearchaeota archaeon]
ILPDLKMNLKHGDSLIGLSEDLTIKFLKMNYENDLKMLQDLRMEYLDDPTKESVIKKIHGHMEKLRKKIDDEFEKYLKQNHLSSKISENTKPFHWAFEFWFAFLDENLESKSREDRGFNVVIGNPPYVDYRSVTPLQAHVFFKKVYTSCMNNPEKYNLFIPFIEKGVRALVRGGQFGYINPIHLLSALMSKKLRTFLLENYRINEIVDLSQLRVFKDAATYPIILLISNETPELIRISYKSSDDDIINRRMRFAEISQGFFLNRKDQVILIDSRKIMIDLITKLESKGDKLIDLVELKWGTSASGYGEKKKNIKEFKGLNDKKKKKYAKMIQSGNIKRYDLNWSGDYLPRDVFPEHQLELFEKPKIVISRQSTSLEAAYDEKGEFCLGKVSFTAKSLKDINYYLLLACLNSKVIDFYFKKIYESLHMASNYIRYDIPYLYQLPVINANTDQQKGIEEKVQKIISLKTIHRKFRSIWRENSRKFRNGYKTLSEVLLDDKKAIQDGDFDQTWISQASLYPDERNDLLKKEFKKFKVEGRENNQLEIYGITGRKVELLLKMETRKKEFRDIIYLELLELLDSRVKKKTLKDILSKSEISIIQPNIWEKSGNLIKITEKSFNEWLENQELQIKVDGIVNIGNKIQEIDNLIDAMVFKLYDLTTDEVTIVLDSLCIFERVKSEILKTFNEMQ